MLGTYRTLTTITDALYQRDLTLMRSISAEEANIRDALNKLEEQARKSSHGTDENDIAIRSLGGDFLWQGWVERKRTSLQMKLVNILVRKAQATQQLRRSFGKNSATEKLQEHLLKDAKMDQAKKRLTEEQSHALFLAQSKKKPD